MNDFNIRIWQDYQSDRVCIVFYRIVSDISAEYYNFYTNEAETVDNGMIVSDKFVMRIPALMAHIFLQKFAEALDSQGIKTDKDAKIQGILEATREHLKDLRQLLKLK